MVQPQPTSVTWPHGQTTEKLQLFGSLYTQYNYRPSGLT